MEEVARREKIGGEVPNGVAANVSPTNPDVTGRSDGRVYGYVSPEARSRLLRQEALRRFYARQWGIRSASVA